MDRHFPVLFQSDLCYHGTWATISLLFQSDLCYHGTWATISPCCFSRIYVTMEHGPPFPCCFSRIYVTMGHGPPFPRVVSVGSMLPWNMGHHFPVLFQSDLCYHGTWATISLCCFIVGSMLPWATISLLFHSRIYVTMEHGPQFSRVVSVGSMLPWNMGHPFAVLFHGSYHGRCTV